MFRRLGLLIQKRLGRDDEPGRADAALQRRVFEKLLLQWMQPFGRRHPFNRGHATPLNLHAQHQAGIHQLAVEQDIAGSAVAVVTAFLAAGQPQLVAQDVEQALPRLTQKVDAAAVDLRLNLHLLGHAQFSFARAMAPCNTRFVSTPTR